MAQYANWGMAANGPVRSSMKVWVIFYQEKTLSQEIGLTKGNAEWIVEEDNHKDKLQLGDQM